MSTPLGITKLRTQTCPRIDPYEGQVPSNPVHLAAQFDSTSTLGSLQIAQNVEFLVRLRCRVSQTESLPHQSNPSLIDYVENRRNQLEHAYWISGMSVLGLAQSGQPAIGYWNHRQEEIFLAGLTGIL